MEYICIGILCYAGKHVTDKAAGDRLNHWVDGPRCGKCRHICRERERERERESVKRPVLEETCRNVSFGGNYHEKEV